MKEETKKWLEYADDNLRAAELLLESELFNPCLQNIQQGIEKLLKALLMELGTRIRKTHSITELTRLLIDNGINVDITEDECDLLDSIYLPSKYPLESVIPDFSPDIKICKQCIATAERIRHSIEKILTHDNG